MEDHFGASNVNHQMYCSVGDWKLEKRSRQHIPRSCMLSSSPMPSISSWNVRSDHSMYKSKWIFNDSAEAKRQKRVVKYKAYTVEGKMKTSFRSGLRWVKDKYCSLVHRY
ncbi:unnamed protein product [Dovyalis caffra]|uniref:DUF3511 domain protein n=1 Tax=Dovyalis caffra TaxID=77055 RepID=A0AAV1QX90_9ROSI|nr:unnamed protein product [Dovyalis caffra]